MHSINSYNMRVVSDRFFLALLVHMQTITIAAMIRINRATPPPMIPARKAGKESTLNRVYILFIHLFI